MTTGPEYELTNDAPAGVARNADTPVDAEGIEMTPGDPHQGNGDTPTDGSPQGATPDDFGQMSESPRPAPVPPSTPGGPEGAGAGRPAGHPGPGTAWRRRAEKYRNALAPGHQARLAERLGLPAPVFGRLGLGWDPTRQSLTCPERDPAGQVVGITRQPIDGCARPIAGGRPGLFYPDGWYERPGPILCVRGVADTAAVEAMGLPVVGIPAHSAGIEPLARLLADQPDDRPVLVMGTDETRADGRRPGKEAAVAVAARLTGLLGRPVLHATPPGARDAHAWLLQRAGGDGAADLHGLGRQFLEGLLAVAREAGEWEPPRPFDQAEVPRFPTGALAGWQRDFVDAEAQATQTPPDLAAMLALAAAAVACAGKAVVRVRPGHEEPLNLFAAVALPPGSRKSAVFGAVVGPIRQHERQRAGQAAPQIAQAASQREILKATLRQRQKAAAKAEGEARDELIAQADGLAAQLAGLVVPAEPRLLTDDATPDRLAGLLAENGGRMGVLSPEGGVFDLMAGKYGGGKSGNFDVFLKGHAGDPLRVDRVSRPPEVVDRPALTLGLAVQPEVIRGLCRIPGARGRGLLGRFLFAMPRSLVGGRDVDPPPVPPSVLEAYGTRMRALLELEPGTDDGGQPGVPQIPLTPAAYQEYLDFEAELEPQLAEAGALGALADWAGKLAGAVARVAGLLHLADQAGCTTTPWVEPISPATMRRAIRVGRYLLAHARVAFALLGRDPLVEDARYLMGWVGRRGGDPFTRRDCFEATKGRFKTVAALEPALGILERHGYLRERLPEGRHGPGRKPSPVYEINPLEPSGVAGDADPAPIAPMPPADIPDGDEGDPSDEPDTIPEVESSDPEAVDSANPANGIAVESPVPPAPEASPTDPANCANDDAVVFCAVTGPGVSPVPVDVATTIQILANGPPDAPSSVVAG